MIKWIVGIIFVGFCSFWLKDLKRYGVILGLESWNSEMNVVSLVERVEWAPHLPFVKELIRMREPTILTNTVVTQWKALEKWAKPNYLANHPSMQMLPLVQKGSFNTFGFIDNKTALAKATISGKISGINLIPNYVELNMSGIDFFNRISDPNEKDYYYWYGKVDGNLRKDVEPNGFIWIDPSDKNNFGLYMWLSSDDVRPPIHYDMDHNFFVHVGGRKRFVLYPPWEWRNMHPFPKLHPKWHKSQVPFDNPDLVKTPNYKYAKSYEALLNPGDVLYVPPYWWHHVQSVTQSVSLASWSQSGIFRSLSGLYERKLVVDGIEDEQQRKAGVKAFLEMLLESIYGKENVKTFIQDQMQAKYFPIRDIFEAIDSWKDTSFCKFTDKFSTDQFRSSFQKDVDYAVKKFEECQGLEVTTALKDVKAIRDLEVGDFMEVIAAEAFGGENVFKFFMHCF